MAFVYLITNTQDGKRYVGQTTRDPARRFCEHMTAAIAKRSDTHLSHAIRRDGPSAFRLEVLHECKTDELDDAERSWIAQLRTDDRELGYNMTLGGQDGAAMTIEVRLKISAGLMGHEVAASTRSQISSARKGMKFSAQHCARMSASHVGVARGPNPDSQRAAASAVHAGKHVGPETCRRISAAKAGKPRPPVLPIEAVGPDGVVVDRRDNVTTAARELNVPRYRFLLRLRRGERDEHGLLWRYCAKE